MKPIETPKIARIASRLPERPAAAPARESAGGNRSRAAESSAAAVLSAGAEAPVETARVELIRKAVAEGKYPVVPARIADAMIAAGYLLRTKK